MTSARHIAAALLLAPALLVAQRPAPHHAPSTVPAIFLSDIHLDPFADPAKVPQLIAAPASGWGAILASPDSPTRAQDYAALTRSCPTKGADTDDRLWQSSLDALRARSPGVRFVTVTGDLLAHSFDCKYKKLAPKPNPAEYIAFAAKTVQYIASGIGAALPQVPVYSTLGNNDSGCADYHLEPAADPFLAAIAPILAGALPQTLSAAERQEISAAIASGGHYTALLPAPFAGVRIIALDDIYFSPEYTACNGQSGAAPAAAQLEWLNAQLSAARARHERVWFLGHIPPGVNLYASARKLIRTCSAGSVQAFLSSDSLATALAENTDIVPLALFGHTHSDEIRLLSPQDLVPAGAAATHAHTAGIPVKIVPAITPINGNLPSFILARVSPATAMLIDYTVIMASSSTGLDTTWKPEYTYSGRYRKPAFDSDSVSSLIREFQSDRTLARQASQDYVGSYTAGVPSPILQLAWAPYTCALSHTTSQSFAACACGN